MTDTEKLIKALDARYAAGQIGFQEGISALANHDALKTAQRLALALAAIEAAKELVAFSISTIGSRGPKAIEDALAAWTKWEQAVTKLEQ